MPRKPGGRDIGGPAAMKNAMQRIKRELAEFNRTMADHQIYSIDTVNDNVLELRGHIYGPPDSPFAGGVFHLDIRIPETYPFHPPKMKFTTRLWHPNVCKYQPFATMSCNITALHSFSASQTGVICLDILKDQWAASLTMRTVMLSLTALLTRYSVKC